MHSGLDAYKACRRIVNALDPMYTSTPPDPAFNLTHSNLDTNDVSSLSDLCRFIYESNMSGVFETSYSKPMKWIGIYIAVASLFCILAMAADLFHGFRNRKLWFPSKYFTLNAASIMVITIAMKLPVDLNNPMPGKVDQFAKLLSVSFMWTMIANLIPSLASMDDKELFANVIGLVILVITMVVNVSIQLETGVLYSVIPILIYIGVILYLLIVLTSSALTTPTSKQILEIKYQAAHKVASIDVHPQHTRMSTVEELMQHLRRYWVMAGTSSPQFVMATTPLCSAAGVICVSCTILQFYLMAYFFKYSPSENLKDYGSDYKWSMLVIFITQSVGVLVGTIAPFFRCFAALSFKLSIKWSKKHTKVFKVEKYWTQKLSEWKQIHLAFPFGGRRSKALVHNLKNCILNLCIGFQKVIVVSCKMIGLIPIGIVIIGVYCVYCWKSLKATFFAMPIASNRDTVHDVEQNGTNEDIGNYVLQLQDEMEIGTRTLKSISNSLNRLIQKAEKKVPNNLLKLVEQSTRFEGVVNFDSDEVEPLISVKLPNSWSLPVVTLTCIAIALPNICKDIVDSLFNGVCEGLSYTLLVEESLNNVGESKNIQSATVTLWREVEVNYKWLGNTLFRNAYKEKTPTEILKWFADEAKEIAVEINRSNNEELLENSRDKLIAANSMYRITQTIMLNDDNNIEPITEEQLFALLSGMIADIMVACLTNLPRVIALKCHESAIEKREASVQAAAKLLGRTKKIIEKLHMRDPPSSLGPDQMAFIDEWRVRLTPSIP